MMGRRSESEFNLGGSRGASQEETTASAAASVFWPFSGVTTTMTQQLRLLLGGCVMGRLSCGVWRKEEGGAVCFGFLGFGSMFEVDVLDLGGVGATRAC